MHNQSYLGTATIGERGQISIPAEARRAYELAPGDKLLFFTIPNRLGLCMLKAKELSAILEHLADKTESIEKLIADLK